MLRDDAKRFNIQNNDYKKSNEKQMSLVYLENYRLNGNSVFQEVHGGKDFYERMFVITKNVISKTLRRTKFLICALKEVVLASEKYGTTTHQDTWKMTYNVFFLHPLCSYLEQMSHY